MGIEKILPILDDKKVTIKKIVLLEINVILHNQ